MSDGPRDIQRKYAPFQSQAVELIFNEQFLERFLENDVMDGYCIIGGLLRFLEPVVYLLGPMQGLPGISHFFETVDSRIRACAEYYVKQD